MSKKSKFAGILSQAVEQKNQLEANVKQNIIVLQELKNLIAPLTEEELQLLEQSILAEGCREPIILWNRNEKFVIVDGHNRYQICQKYNLDFKFEVRNFESLEDVKNWMINNQLGKRNLTEQQKSYLRGLRYLNEKKKVGGSGKNQYSNVVKLTTLPETENKSNADNLTTLRTTEKLAQIFQVSPKTIERDAKFALGLDYLVGEDAQLKNQILNKFIKIPTGIIQKLADNKKDKEKIKKEILERYIEKKLVPKKTNETQTDTDYKKKILEILKKMSEKELKNLYEQLKKFEK
ncbi:MAG: ParB N-terminal domain-containing protein [Raineya sp.]|nr:ParB N-terminal domain-containing protein [Raineya sp.]